MATAKTFAVSRAGDEDLELSWGTLYRVKKTSIYLEPSLDESLAKLAADEGLTKAELIRRRLAASVARPKRPKLSLAVFAGDGRPAAEDEARLDETDPIA